MCINHKTNISGYIMFFVLSLFILSSSINAQAQEQTVDATETQSDPNEEQTDSSVSSIIDIIKQHQDDTPRMQSIKRKAPEKENDVDASTENKDETKSSDPKNGDEIIKEELEQREKIWNNYKKAAENSEKEDKDKKSETEEEKEPSEEEKKEEQSRREEEKPHEIQNILDRYKKSVKSKGKINSRSFGSID